VEFYRRVLLHRLGDVGVQVERGADGRVSKTLLRHFGMHASEQKLSGVRMPQIMARNVFKVADKVGELVRQATRLVRLAIGAGAN
jgi:hypothetical protein